MEKLKMHSPDLVAGNIEKIAALFQNCITEAKDANGKITRAVDFDLLKQELSGSLVEGPQERYRLDWPGKRETLSLANAPIAKTLRPCREESVNFDATKNLFIEGDNLDALKLLQESYLGKINMIYIDPPYNTGSDFLYKDDFTEDSEEFLIKSNQRSESGNQLVANTETNGRFHSDWLSMLYPRLRLAKNLLHSSGLIFISIDDNEIHNIRNLGDEIFGQSNLVAVFKWNRTAKAPSLSDSVRKKYEYVVCYKRGGSIKLRGKKSYNTQGPLLHLPNKQASIVFPPRSIKIPSAFAAALYSEKYKVELLEDMAMSSDGFNENQVVIKGCFAWGQPKISEYIKQGKHFVVKKSLSTIYYELDNEGEYIAPSDIISDDECGVKRNTEAKEEMRSLGLDFDYSKPISLIKYLVNMLPESNDGSEFIALDFFAGSSTTAHAILDLNGEDGGNRMFIMVQLPEKVEETSDIALKGYKTISQISKERIRRAGAKVRHENATTAADLDFGFRVLKVDDSNMAQAYYAPDEFTKDDLIANIENIKPGRTPDDLLFQVLVDWGVSLSLPISTETIAGKTVFFVDGNALAACFDTDISENLVTALAKRRLHDLPQLKVVFRDAGYASDSAKINVEQIFKLLSPTTELRTL